MPSFFASPASDCYKNAFILKNYTDKKVAFNPNDISHQTLIANCTKELEKRLLEIQNIDKKIIIGFSLSAIAFSLSWLLPLTIISAIGFVYTAYQLGLRQQAQTDYRNALDNLVDCCKWSLGRGQEERAIHNVAVRNMVDTLAPLTNDEQLGDLIDAKFTPFVDQQTNQSKDNVSIMNHHLSVEEVSLYYKIYGYEQGGAVAVMQGIGYAIVSGFKMAKVALFRNPNEETVVAKP